MQGAKVIDPVCGPHGVPDKNVDKPTGEKLKLDDVPERVRVILKDLLERKFITEDDLNTYFCFTPTATLDFASLYPSIMMSFIFCTFTIDLGKLGHSKVEKHYEKQFPSPDIDDSTIKWHYEHIYQDDDPSSGVILQTYKYIQNAEEPFANGILPKSQKEMQVQRKQYVLF